MSPTLTPLEGSGLIGTPYWPSGSTTAAVTSAPASGVGCADLETYHIHAHLSILLDGVQLAVPDHIGFLSCVYSLHTHDMSGVIHIETGAPTVYTLGQLFAVWGQPLSRTNVAGLMKPVTVYVALNGKLTRYDGDITQLQLQHFANIYLVVGSIPAVLPSFLWPSGL